MAALLMVVALSLASTVAVQQAQTLARREREAQLLWVGNQYRKALESYKAATPVGAPPNPQKLTELLADPRSPRPLRHLRELYPDPMTGRADWILVAAQGRIVGVHSASMQRPLKVAGFNAQDAAFERATTYGDWVFTTGVGSPNLAPATKPGATGPENPRAPGSGPQPLVPGAPAAVAPLPSSPSCESSYAAAEQACDALPSPADDACREDRKRDLDNCVSRPPAKTARPGST
jgi:type II secretory pathway pseudopilin PulG